MTEPMVYLEEGRRPVYRASSAGRCRRALGAARLGYEPLPEAPALALAAREGRRHEEWMVEDLAAEGYEVRDRQREVRINLAALSIVGHIDGLVCVGSDLLLLEVKSMSRFRFEAFARKGFDDFPDYAAQVAVYHRAERLPVLYVVKCRDTGRTVRRVLEEPPVPFAYVSRRLIEVEIHARRGLLPEPECRPGDYLRFTCPYRHMCEEEEEILEPVQDLAPYADMYRRGKALEDEAQELLKEAREKFLEALRAGGRDSVTVSGLSAKLVSSERKSYREEDLAREMLGQGIPEAVVREVLGRAARVSRVESLRFRDLWEVV